MSGLIRRACVLFRYRHTTLSAATSLRIIVNEKYSQHDGGQPRSVSCVLRKQCGRAQAKVPPDVRNKILMLSGNDLASMRRWRGPPESAQEVNEHERDSRGDHHSDDASCFEGPARRRIQSRPPCNAVRHSNQSDVTRIVSTSVSAIVCRMQHARVPRLSFRGTDGSGCEPSTSWIRVPIGSEFVRGTSRDHAATSSA